MPYSLLICKKILKYQLTDEPILADALAIKTVSVLGACSGTGGARADVWAAERVLAHVAVRAFGRRLAAHAVWMRWQTRRMTDTCGMLIHAKKYYK